MLTYKCFFKIVKANMTTFLLYSSIFIVMSVVAGMFAGGQQGEYIRWSGNIGVINRDSHPVSYALIYQLGRQHNIILMEDDIEKLTDEIFFDRVRYAFVINENFGARLAAGYMEELNFITTPQNVGFDIIAGRQINTFLRVLKGYMAAGFDYSQAIALTAQTLENEVTVIQSDEIRFISRYFGSLTFISFTLVIMSLSLTMMVFKDKNLASRLYVSPNSKRTKILWFTLSGGSLAYGMWALMLLPAIFLHHEPLLSAGGALHMLNSFVLVTVCIAIAILLTETAKNEDVIVRVTTVIGIIASMTGGPFVNVEDTNIVVQTFARFTPSFWNAQNNDLLYGAFLGTDVNMADFWMNIVIQICFAAAFFAVALVIGREKTLAEA